MLGQLWAAQRVELFSSGEFWTSLLLAALCSSRTAPAGSMRTRSPFGHFQARPLPGASSSFLLCCCVGQEQGAEGAEAAFPSLLCPWNSTHLHTLPPKGMKGFTPQLNNSLEENRRLCSTLKISYFFKWGVGVLLCKHWEDNGSLFEF